MVIRGIDKPIRFLLQSNFCFLAHDDVMMLAMNMRKWISKIKN